MEKSLETLKTAVYALRANKLRSLLTMLGIIIGVMSVILLLAIGAGLKTYVTAQLEGLGADALFVIPGEFELAPGGGGSGGTPGAGISSSKFTFNHVRDLERSEGAIKYVMAYTENNGTMEYKGKTKITQVAGVSSNYQEIRDQKVTQGSFFTTSQYNTAKKVAILGDTVAKDLFGEDDPVGKKMTISGGRFTILGVLEKKGSLGGSIDMDNQVFIPATTAMKQFDMQYIQSLWIKAQSVDDVPQAKKEVEKILLKNLEDDEFSILDTQSILNVVSNILGVLTAALGGIAAISLVVGGIGIMNIMLVSVTERTREIGLRKAVGATPRMILTQFLMEAIVLSFFGGAIGIFLGVGSSLLIGKFFTTTITLWSIILSFGVSALIGIIFGVAPAARAARLDPITALRYE